MARLDEPSTEPRCGADGGQPFTSAAIRASLAAGPHRSHLSLVASGRVTPLREECSYGARGERFGDGLLRGGSRCGAASGGHTHVAKAVEAAGPVTTPVAGAVGWWWRADHRFRS